MLTVTSITVSTTLFRSNVLTVNDVVTQRLLQEQASLVNKQVQDLYSPLPGSYTVPVESITAPPPDQEPVTPTSYQSVFTDQFLDMANSMQLREQDLHNRAQQMLMQMQDLMSRMLSQNSGSNNRNHNNTSIKNNKNNNRRPTGRGGRTSSYAGRTQAPRPSSTRHYCWTHGACTHVRTECTTLATGHQAQATFSDMKNGSTTD